MKNFFASKINWAGIILFLMALVDTIKNWGDQPLTWQNVSVAVIGLLIVLFRTFGGNKQITGAKRTGL